ncbi:MAG: hypothetical protein HC837_10710 [Chloroflexaceae bacterium]|nr:hypothetical protein [Chloroflexaceae bacterium]
MWVADAAGNVSEPQLLPVTYDQDVDERITASGEPYAYRAIPAAPVISNDMQYFTYMPTIFQGRNRDNIVLSGR